MICGVATMSDEIKKYEQKPLVIPENANLQIGDRNLQVGHVEKLNNTMIFLPSASIQTAQTNSPRSFNNEHYHLFVIEDALSGHFVVPSVRALTESISSPVKERYAHLSNDAIDEIKSFPAIFATKNHNYGKTDAGHVAKIGFIEDITIQDNGIRICASYFWDIAQQKLNDCREKLAIESASSFNELNRTHWTIKRINLIEVLRDEGLFPF